MSRSELLESMAQRNDVGHGSDKCLADVGGRAHAVDVDNDRHGGRDAG